MKIVAIAATTNKFLYETSTRKPFTIKNLKQFAKEAIGCPVYSNLPAAEKRLTSKKEQPIGHIDHAYVDGAHLIIEATVNNDRRISKRERLLLGYKADYWTLEPIKFQCVFIDIGPLDLTIPPIEIISR